MDSNGAPPYSSRDTYVAVLLCVLVGLPLFVFFNLITFGLFVFLLLTLAGIAAFAGVHYLLWGRAFTRETAGEREEEQLRAQLEAEMEQWGYDERTDRSGP